MQEDELLIVVHIEYEVPSSQWSSMKIKRLFENILKEIMCCMKITTPVRQ